MHSNRQHQPAPRPAANPTRAVPLRRVQIRQDDRGASAVELAIVLPILIMLVFGIIEFGRAYNAKVTLTHAAREAVRQYAIQQDESIVEGVAFRNSVAPALAGATITVTDPCNGTDDASLGFDVARVQVVVTLPYDIPLVKSGDFDLEETAVMRCNG